MTSLIIWTGKKTVIKFILFLMGKLKTVPFVTPFDNKIGLWSFKKHVDICLNIHCTNFHNFLGALSEKYQLEKCSNFFNLHYLTWYLISYLGSLSIIENMLPYFLYLKKYKLKFQRLLENFLLLLREVEVRKISRHLIFYDVIFFYLNLNCIIRNVSSSTSHKKLHLYVITGI